MKAAFLRFFGIVVGAITIAGCISLKSLPTSTEEVTFVRDTDGSYEGPHFVLSDQFPSVDIELALRAARAGLLYADFEVVDMEVGQNVILSQRKMTANTNYFVAGVYVRESDDGAWIKLLVNGDFYHDDWAERIYSGIRLFIDAELR